MRLEKFWRRSRKWRSEGLLGAQIAMIEVRGAIAWYGCFILLTIITSAIISYVICLGLWSLWPFLVLWQIILDAPTVGGRLMLVDMAGSENIEQAGQVGFEAKMQVNYVKSLSYDISECILGLTSAFTILGNLCRLQRLIKEIHLWRELLNLLLMVTLMYHSETAS